MFENNNSEDNLVLMYDAAIGKLVLALRNVHNMSQEELAGKLNCDVETINKIESGLCDVSYTGVLKLSSIFNISALDIFKYVEDTISFQLDEIQLSELINKTQ